MRCSIWHQPFAQTFLTSGAGVVTGWECPGRCGPLPGRMPQKPVLSVEACKFAQVLLYRSSGLASARGGHSEGGEANLGSGRPDPTAATLPELPVARLSTWAHRRSRTSEAMSRSSPAISSGPERRTCWARRARLGAPASNGSNPGAAGRG